MPWPPWPMPSSPGFGPLVLMAAFTGLRRGELLAVTRQRIDLLHQTVAVVEQRHDLPDGSLLLAPPKTEAGPPCHRPPTAFGGRAGAAPERVRPAGAWRSRLHRGEGRAARGPCLAETLGPCPPGRRAPASSSRLWSSRGFRPPTDTTSTGPPRSSFRSSRRCRRSNRELPGSKSTRKSMSLPASSSPRATERRWRLTGRGGAGPARRSRPGARRRARGVSPWQKG